MLTAEDRHALDKAVDEICYVTKDAEGNKCIELHADYMDTNEGLLQLAYDHRSVASLHAETSGLLDALRERIASFYTDTILQIEDDILQKAGFSPDTDRAEAFLTYLREAYTFQIPYDHYLSQRMRVNLMLEYGSEGNRDFAAIHDQAEAISGLTDAETLTEETSLSWLVSQQGYTMDDLRKTMQDYIHFFYGEASDHSISHSAQMTFFHKIHSVFLSSVCQEFMDMTNTMNTLTALADVSMYDFCKLMQPGHEIVLPKDTVLGIFSPWMGGGSTLDIQLEKELVLPTDLIWDVQVEGADLVNQHALDSVYGLTLQAWKQAIAVRQMPEQAKNKPALDAVLRDADNRKGGAASEHRQQIPHHPQRGGDMD